MDPSPEPPKTPPNKFPNPPTPHAKSPPRRISCDINTRDALGPFYWESFNKPPDFEVPLKGGDFKERPTLEEWADKLGYRLPSGESVLAGRPDPSELNPGAKLPPSIEDIDRLLDKGDKYPAWFSSHCKSHPSTDVRDGSLSGRSPNSEPKSKPGTFLKLAEGLQKKADTNDPTPSSENPNQPKVTFGAMLPPPLKGPRGLHDKADRPTVKPPPEQSNQSKQEVGAMSQRLLKGAVRHQDMVEMMEMADPKQAEEDRAKVFMDRLHHVQAASRRLQGQLGIHGDETWPLPPLPDDRNPFVIETNAIKIRAALEHCKDFAVPADRSSSKFEFLDVVAKNGKKRVVMKTGQAPEIRLTSFDDEKKAREAEASRAIARMMDEGLQEELKELEDEGMSAVPSTSKSPFHSAGPSSAPTTSQPNQVSISAAGEDEDMVSNSQEGSSVDTLERLRRNPRFRGIGLFGPEYDPSPTPDSLDRSDATDTTPQWIHREIITPDPYHDSEGNSMPHNTSRASNDNQEMRTPYGTEALSAASAHIVTALAPPSRELNALSIHESEVRATQSVIDEAVAGPNAQDKGKSRVISHGIEESMSDGLEVRDKGKGKQTISDFNEGHTDDGNERHGKTTRWSREKLDVAGSLRNHSLTFLDETQPKAKVRDPPVPRPENMPGTLTEAICNYIPLEAKSILTLTLERVDPPVSFPTNQRCILLKHFEIGLDGVEGLCQGTAKIPEAPGVTAERERRVGKIGTFKQGDGGFYRSLRSAQQKDQQYGKGYWYFFGVKFKQTSKERKLRRGGKWLLFGAPIEAVYHLDIKRSQENVAVTLGGGVDKSGTAIQRFEANFKRTHTLFSRGGGAPMDIWSGGEDWDDGVFKDIKAAMSHNGLRVGFLYGDAQTFTPKPSGFPAAGKLQAEKRKQCGPEMTEDEMKAMEKSMKPKKLSDEDIGTILAMSVINDRAKQDAAARSP